MKKNKNGQALVEFVIILPIFLLLLFTAIDFGKIIYTKIALENITNDVVDMYKRGKGKNTITTYIKKNDKNATIKIKNKNNYTTFYIYSKVVITTPGLNVALNNPYEIGVKRVIYNE